MAEIVGRCGFRCDLCPAYRDNTATEEERKRASEGWSAYFGVVVPSERIRCRGCLADASEGFEFHDPDCPVRPCVIERGFPHCAPCPDYPCPKLETRIAGFEHAAARFRDLITQEEYDVFLAPYDARRTLDRLRRKKLVR